MPPRWALRRFLVMNSDLCGERSITQFTYLNLIVKVSLRRGVAWQWAARAGRVPAVVTRAVGQTVWVLPDPDVSAGSDLPVRAVLPELMGALDAGGAAILVAPPGSGTA